MSSIDEIIGLIEKRKNEGIAIILRFKESECDSYLPDDTKDRLRKIILDQMNDVNGLSRALIRTLHDDSVVLNRVYLDKIQDLHDVLIDE